MSTRILRHPSGLVVTAGWDPDQGAYYLDLDRDGQVQNASGLTLDAVMDRIRATGCQLPPNLRTGLHADQLCQSRALLMEYEFDG